MCTEGWWCSVDWGAVGQVAAIVMTGGAATLVAYFQLRTLAQNEQTRATIEYVTSYDSVLKQVPGVGAETVAVCMTRINDLLRDEALLKRYAAFASVFRGNPDAAETVDPFPPYQTYSNSAIAVVNYFMLASLLLYKKRLDSELFIGSMSDTIIEVGKLAEKLAAIEPFAREFQGDRAATAMVKLAREGKKST